MKKFILHTILVLSFSDFAYSQNSTGIRDSINFVFAELDTAYIPSGILFEKASPSLNWANFRAVNDSATNISIWKGMYKVLRNGSVSAINSFLSEDSLANLFVQAREENVIPLCILYYNYEQLKPQVLDSNLLSVSGKQLLDVPGRNESPYTQNSIFNACAAFNVSYGASARFVLDPSFYFSNDTSSITKIEIDFDDGVGYRLAAFGDTIQIAYADTLAHVINFRIILNGGDSLTSSSRFIILPDICDRPYPHDLIEPICGEILFTAEPTPIPYTCAKFTLTYGYEDDGITKHGCIKKPLLFVSGFDPGYQDYPTTYADCKYGRLGWIDIITGYNHNLENPFKSEPYDPEFLEGPDFFNSLFLMGYDVIFLDFADGTDYMQKNAFVLVEMINWINENKCAEEELIIIGASMGGQLVRYALTYMEMNNLPHCTKLSISFDSPSQGANILFGLQKFVEFGNDVFPDFLEATDAFEYQIKTLKSPAAKQLLIPHFDGNPYNNLITDLRTAFYDELFEMDEDGYANNVHNIAIANGNKTGTPQQSISPGNKFMDLYYNFLLLKVNAEAYLLPGHEIYHYEFYGDWEIDLGLISIGFNQTGSALNDTPLYDTAPGAMQTGLQEQLTENYNDLWIFSAFEVTADNFCFVPSISALDVNTEYLNYNIFDNIDPNNPNPLYPFQSFYSPFPFSSGNNENHVQLTDLDIEATNDGNTAWAIDMLHKYEYTLSSVLPEVILGSTFNYGNKYRNTLHSLDINSDGLLQINGNYNTDYGDGDPAIAASTFTVATSECSNSIININSGGVLEIGDDNDPYDNNKGILELLEGGEIHVKNGGTLKIRKGSQLNLRSGSTLFLEPGGSIEIEEVGYLAVDNGGLLKLNGGIINLRASNAQLKLYAEGEIQVAAGVDFTLDSEGFFEYYQDGIFTMLGTTSKFILEGDSDTDLKMRLQENADFFLETHDVDIYNCKLSFNDNALFRVEANNTSLDLVNYEDFSTSVKARSAILASNIVSLDVYNCDFTGFSNPVKVEDVSVCPGDVNVNIQFSTFSGMGNLAITATNVDRIYMNGNTITGSANAFGGVWLEDVTDATIDNGTIQGFSGSTDAGVFLLNTARLVLDAAVIKNNKYGVDMHASSIYLRNKTTIKNNYTGIYAFGGIDYGTTNPTGSMKKISVGDIGCGWIINNTAYGINSLDMQLEIDQIIHDNNDSSPGDPIPNRFDGNLYGIQACYNYYDADDLGDTEIMAEHNHWKTDDGPASGYLQAGFDEDTHPCTSMNFSTACYIETKPTNCACNYNDCEETDCAEELTEAEITLRLATTSCNSTIPKPGGNGTITVGEQFRVAYLKYLNGDYNYAYQSFLYLKNKVNQNYPQGLTKGVCNTLYREAVMYVELCSLLATVHCQQPFYTGRLAEEFSDTEFKVELYPNPTNTIFTLSTDMSEIVEFKIIDITGREIITNSFQTNTNISVVGWPSGIYLVHLKSVKTGLITTEKLMVE